MLEGVHRVLKPDGIFISISFGQVSQIKFIASSFNICTMGKIILLARVTCIQRMISCVVQCTYICCIENFLERKKKIPTWNWFLMQPHFRRPFFNAPKFTWSFEHVTFGDGFHYFFYILRKVSAQSAEVLIVFGSIYESILTFYRERDHQIVKNLVRNPRRRLLICFMKNWRVRITYFEPTLMKWIVETPF